MEGTVCTWAREGGTRPGSTVPGRVVGMDEDTGTGNGSGHWPPTDL